MKDLATLRCRFLLKVWLSEFKLMKLRENFDILSTRV